jgi:hypothetical protein
MASPDGPKQEEHSGAPEQRTGGETNHTEEIGSPITAENADCKAACKKKDRWEIAHHVISIMTLIFVGTYTALTLCLYEVTKKTMVAANRAWIEPRFPRIAKGLLNPIENFEYELPYANIGKEPALQIVMQHKTRFVAPKSSEGSWYERFQGRNEFCSLSHPNKEGFPEYPSGQERKIGANTGNPLPEVKAVLDGSQVLVIEGCYGYLTFDEPHYSAFCYFLPPIKGKPISEWMIARCPTHNDAT